MITPDGLSSWFIGFVSASIVLGALVVSQPAGAQDAFTCIDELSEAELDYRTEIISESFRKGRKKAVRWRAAWIGAMAVSAAGSFYTGAKGGRLAQPSGNPKWRRFYDYALGAGSAFTVLKFAAMPMPDVWGHKRIRKMKSSTIEEKRAKLRYATKKLKSSAFIENYLTGLDTYIGAIAFGTVFGSVYAAKWNNDYGGSEANPKRKHRALDRLRVAGLFLLPVANAAGQSMTGPTHSIKDWEKYRGIACSSKYYDSGSDDDDIDLDLSVTPMNISMKLTF